MSELRVAILKRRLIGVIYCTVIWLLGGQEPAFSTGLTTCNVAAEVTQLHDRIRSLDIRYKAKTRNESQLPVEFFIETRLVAKDRFRFRESLHSNSQRPSNTDLNHICQIFTGRSFDMFIVPSRYYETSKNTASLEHPWKLRHDLLLDCLGWWPREDDTPRSDDPSIARHLRFAVSSPAYSVVTESEVDANPCWLIESPGRDRIWLDPAIGFAIRRRETSDKDTKALLRIQTSTDFQEQRFSADQETYTYWYPRQIIEQSFEVSGTSKTQKSIIVEVLELRLNEVEDEAFEFHPPPGTIISNRDTGEINTLPGGRDLLDHTVTMASAILDLHPEKRIAQGHARDLSLFVLMGIGGGAICIGVFMCWPILVRFRRIH